MGDGGCADMLIASVNKFKSYLRNAFSQLNEFDVEDVISQTALNLLVRGTDGVSNASAYIYAALRNCALNMIKKSRRELPNEKDAFLYDNAADEKVLREDLKQQLKTALLSLDQKSRFVFIQTELYGKSYKRLSEETGEPIGTLLSRKSRAARKLSVLLYDYYKL
ncbi:MAG: sigma-70 family RNA polymerase sigma factor [Christensenellales bacterium]